MFFPFRLFKHQIKTLERGYFFSFSQGHKHFLEIIWGTDLFSTVEVLKSPFRQKKKKQKTKAFIHCFYHHFLFK